MRKKMMNKALAVAAAVALVCLGGVAQADVFNLGAGFTNLETVAVGGAGNVGELSGLGAGGSGPDRICGAVGYNYNIGKYEVTAAQYADFLNNRAKTSPWGLYNTSMWDWSSGCKIQRSGSGTVENPFTYSVDANWANKPVNFVSYWDACRFTNWIENGQGGGDTETGAYTLNGYNGGDDRNVPRNAGAKWFLTSEDEWYKAAYYTGSGYSPYANGTNTKPTAGVNTNYDGAFGTPWDVGTGTTEQNGTYDMMGNVLEWNEAVIFPEWTDPPRGLRGGSCLDNDDHIQASNSGSGSIPSDESVSFGFRVAYMPDGWQPVPEPSSILALLCGLGGLAWRRQGNRQA